MPCDGVLVEGSDIKVNEYALTGDRRDVDKNDEYPFLMAGTQMVGGYGYMMVIAVGEHSFKGNIVKLLAAGEDVPTGLQHKLETAAHEVGKMGLYGMLLMLAILGLWFGMDLVETGANGWRDRYTSLLLEFLVNGIGTACVDMFWLVLAVVFWLISVNCGSAADRGGAGEPLAGRQPGARARDQADGGGQQPHPAHRLLREARAGDVNLHGQNGHADD